MMNSITMTSRTLSCYAPAVSLPHWYTCLAAAEADAAMVHLAEHKFVFPPGHDAKFCCCTPRTADSPETKENSTDTPQIAHKVQKVQPGFT